MVEEERLISEFNEAKFQIFRLHNLWMECKALRESGKLMGWKWKLDTATIELWNDAGRLDGDEKDDEDGKDSYIQKLENLDKDIREAEDKKDFKTYYEKLMWKERLLRKIQEESGKGAKFRPADDDGI